jgi:hypothetical protein
MARDCIINREVVPQDIQEILVKLYIEGELTSTEEIADKLTEYGYNLKPDKINNWKTYKDARVFKRNIEWEESKDELSSELPKRTKEINEAMKFYSDERAEIIKLLNKEKRGTKEYKDLLEQLTILEKNNELANNKYVALLKLVEINSSAIKTEEGEGRTFEHILELVRGWDEK